VKHWTNQIEPHPIEPGAVVIEPLSYNEGCHPQVQALHQRLRFEKRETWHRESFRDAID
jgi:hypothetical protein